MNSELVRNPDSSTTYAVLGGKAFDIKGNDVFASGEMPLTKMPTFQKCLWYEKAFVTNVFGINAHWTNMP